MTTRFRIEFEGFPDPDGAYLRAQGLLPFRLIAMADSDSPSLSYAFGVNYQLVSLEYEFLRKEPEGNSLEQAAIRWAISQVEESIRFGRMPPAGTKETQKFALREAELEVLKRMALAKKCEYQRSSGRDLYCAAAGSTDDTAVGSDGLRRLAPTSGAICAECDMRDADFVCSHLAHPQVIGVETMNEPTQRQLMRAYCEMGRPEIGQPSGCHAGGHPCWRRIIEPRPASPPAVPFSPRDLPVALDFLDAIWKQAFGRSLIRLRSVEKTAALSLPCATEEELRSRLGDLNELLKLMDVPEEILPEEKRGQIDKQQTFNRMACLDAKIQDDAEGESTSEAMLDLRALNVVRNKLTHGGSELADALERLGLEYPIKDYGQAWDQIRLETAAALTTIRSALQGAL